MDNKKYKNGEKFTTEVEVVKVQNKPGTRFDGKPTVVIINGMTYVWRP